MWTINCIEINYGTHFGNVKYLCQEIFHIMNHSTPIQIFQRIEKQFILKQDRFRVIFFPMLCTPEASVAVDDLNRLEGFIFLKQASLDAFKEMPTGCQFCAAFLNDKFTFEHQDSKLSSVTISSASLKQHQQGKLTNQEIISLIKMPVKSFGYFEMEKGANN